MQWSHYSEAIFDAYINTDENIIVQACPGAGKTTNIQHIWGMDDKTKCYLVFNKHNQLEAQAKLPLINGSDILTLNSLGHRAIYNTFGRVILDDRKVMNIIRKNGIQGKNKDNQYTLSKLVQIAKGVDTGDGINVDTYCNILDTYDIDEYGGMYTNMQHVLSISDGMTDVIDYADQLRFPVIYNCNMSEYERVLGDEVQDFNPVQAKLIELLAADRYILVGDCHQSMYGFRGAMTNSMSALQTQFNCTQYPLSITYRCAQKIVAIAAGLYKDIEPWSESPKGTVRHSDPAQMESYTQEDIILCRMNRPLISMAYDLLSHGTPCYVRGRDIGEGLIRLITKQGCFTVCDLMGRLEESYAVEVERARLKDDSAMLQRVEDKYTSAMLFCTKAKLNDTPQVVIDNINNIFNNGHGVCLSTVHKAKGLEAKRAFILQPGLFEYCRQKAKHSWQKEQEKNIQYVAVTRAKHELVYLT